MSSSEHAPSEERVAKRARTSAENPWEELGVCRELAQAALKLGWSSPTPIQREAIPAALEKRDVIALAETGSGKTGAFAIPVVHYLLEEKGPRMYAVALAPTRELCVQISETFAALGAGIALKTACIVGGLSMVDQAAMLAKRPHVIVASPGRLVDHLTNTKGFSLAQTRYLIMDEADRLLSMDFEEALDKIVSSVPRERRRTMLFSATMTSKVGKLKRACLVRPVKVEVNSKHDVVKTLVQRYLLCPMKLKMAYLSSLLRRYDAYSAIIFVDTCAAAQKICAVLRHLRFPAIALHGQMTQQQRLGALNTFKVGGLKSAPVDGEEGEERTDGPGARILIATDVASRGLDIPHVDLVVNFDISKSSKDYVHRVGRTARAGRSGRAVTLVTQYDVAVYQKLEEFLSTKLEEEEGITKDDALRWKERVDEAVRQSELEAREDENQVTKLRRKLGRRGQKKPKR